MYFPDRGCVHTLLTLYVYATALLDSTGPGGLGSAAKHVGVTVIYTAREPYKIHNPHLCLLYYSNQCACRLLSSHINSCMQQFRSVYNPLRMSVHSSTAVKSGGGPCTFGPPHCQKVGGQDPRTPQDRRHWAGPLYTRDTCAIVYSTVGLLYHCIPLYIVFTCSLGSQVK